MISKMPSLPTAALFIRSGNIGHRMSQVLLKVLPVSLDEVGHVVQDQEVLSIIMLRRPGEIEGPGDQHVIVDNHDFVVGNGVLIVDIDPDARIIQKGGHISMNLV